MSKVLETLRRDKRVEDVSDERDYGNGIIVTMRGYTNDPLGACHVFGADTPSAALKYLRDCVKCECNECSGIGVAS